MRKLYSLFALFVMLLSFASCEDKPAPGPNKPDESTKPEIAIESKVVEPNSFTFEVTTNVAGELGYCVVRAGYEAPSVDEWFAANSANVSDKLEITVSNLSDNSSYMLYAILRGEGNSGFSNPVTLQFTTPDDGVQSPIDVVNVTYTSITFTISVAGNYLFQCIDKPFLDEMGISPEKYIATPGIGIPSSGEQTIDWNDGGVWGPYNMSVREDCDYYIIVALTDSNNNIVGDIFIESLRTPKRPTTDAGVTTELLDITSTSVNIKTTPDAVVSEYYVYVRDKAWSDDIVENNGGESMLARLITWESAGSWVLTTNNEQVWAGLIPSTEYYCHILVIDNKGSQALTRIPFTTSAATSQAPKVEASMNPASENGHMAVNINIYSAEATSVNIALHPMADIETMRSQNKTDSQIAIEEGFALTAEQIANLSTVGLTVTNNYDMNPLWPETEYVAIISVRNNEQTETIKVLSTTTLAAPIPTRVESNLFTTLQGDWNVSYSLVQYNGNQVRIDNVPVKISQGADDKSAIDYRNQNRLVITGWPFSVSAMGTLEEIPYLSPEDLMEQSRYWRDYPSLAYRDYGPKIFLEIAAGDVVTVPSGRHNFFYNWSTEGVFYFFGCDLDAMGTAPSPFPVTVSADGNTITIGACHSGAEFNYGVYRPSVFRNSEYWSIATSDIVLTRIR